MRAPCPTCTCSSGSHGVLELDSAVGHRTCSRPRAARSPRHSRYPIGSLNKRNHSGAQDDTICMQRERERWGGKRGMEGGTGTDWGCDGGGWRTGRVLFITNSSTPGPTGSSNVNLNICALENKRRSSTHSYTGVTATLWPRHLELSAQQINSILLLTRTGVLQRPHAIGLGAAHSPAKI